MNRAKHRPTGEYPIGYCKPPERTQFKEGQPSPNPKGRPRKPRIESQDPLDILKSAVTVREGDKLTEMPAVEAQWRAIVRLALQHKVRYATEFVRDCDKHGIFAIDLDPTYGILTVPDGRFDELTATLEETGQLPEDWQNWLNRDPAEREAYERARHARRKRRGDQPLAQTPRDVLINIAFELRPVKYMGVVRRMTTLQVVMLVLRQARIEGNLQAKRICEYLDETHGASTHNGKRGFIIVPEALSPQEWIRRYGKDEEPVEITAGMWSAMPGEAREKWMKLEEARASAKS